MMENLEYDVGINFVIKKVNPKVEYEFKRLIVESLNGDVDALITISERIYCGLLNNVSLFIPEIDLMSRRNIVIWLAKKVFKKNYLDK